MNKFWNKKCKKDHFHKIKDKLIKIKNNNIKKNKIQVPML